MRTAQITFLTILLVMRAGLVWAQDNPKWYLPDHLVRTAGARCAAQAQKPNIRPTDKGNVFVMCMEEFRNRHNIDRDNLECHNSSVYIRCMTAKGYELRCPRLTGC